MTVLLPNRHTLTALQFSFGPNARLSSYGSPSKPTHASQATVFLPRLHTLICRRFSFFCNTRLNANSIPTQHSHAYRRAGSSTTNTRFTSIRLPLLTFTRLTANSFPFSANTRLTRNGSPFNTTHAWGFALFFAFIRSLVYSSFCGFICVAPLWCGGMIWISHVKPRFHRLQPSAVSI